MYIPGHAGWWMIDAQGLIGWAPASYLVPVDETDLEEEAEENENLIEQERGKCAHVHDRLKPYANSIEANHSPIQASACVRVGVYLYVFLHA